MATRKWSEKVEKKVKCSFCLSIFSHYLFIFQTSNIKKEMLIEEGKNLQNLIKNLLQEVIQFAIQTGKCL